MAQQGQQNFIELSGISRSTSITGAKDGQCEDLVNLIYKDGSWRRANDGKLVYTDNDGYSQFFIHTNVYRHLLGVKDGKLWWITDIEHNGEFKTDQQPVELCDVSGNNLYYCQTGNLLTIVGNTTIYIVFTAGQYKLVSPFHNGEQDSKILPPDGIISFRTVPLCENNENVIIYTSLANRAIDVYADGQDGNGNIVMNRRFNTDGKNWLKAAYNKMNRYIHTLGCPTGCFMVCTALKTYTGEYVLASRPVYMDTFMRGNYPYESKTITRVETSRTYNVYANKDLPFGFDVRPRVQVSNIYGELSYNDIHADFDEGNAVDLLGNSKVENDSAGILKDDAIWKLTRAVGRSIYAYGDKDILNSDTEVEVGEDDLYGYNMSISYPYYSNIARVPKRLQIHFSQQFNSSYKDIFQSVCVFISPMIDPFLFDDEIEYKYRVLGSTASDGVRNVLFRHAEFKRYTAEKLNEKLENLGIFYLVKEFKLDETDKINTWLDVTIDEYVLENLLQQDRLVIDTNMRNGIKPIVAYNYNGRLHLANYIEEYFMGFPLPYFFSKDESNDGEMYGEETMQTDTYNVDVVFEIDGSLYKVRRSYTQDRNIHDDIPWLNPLLSYPSTNAKYIYIWCNTSAGVKAMKFELKAHPYLNISYYFNQDGVPIRLNLTENYNPDQYPYYDGEKNANKLRVSSTNNPLYFPVEHTYQVGSGTILAMCTNTTAVGTGQTGAAPLIVFCTDGIYALFVDSTGEMAYTNARPIARDVCNNANSVTPVDNGIVFTTDRGLMEISGEQVVELGQIAEGDVLDFTNINTPDYIKVCATAFKHAQLADLLSLSNETIGNLSSTDFLNYLKDAIINYNHNERELWVSSLSHPYSYVLDRNGNWSRRDVSADEYVNNYPTSYRVQNGQFYQVDEDDNTDSNSFFVLSRAIKLGTLNFKQAYRFIARGYFETPTINNTPDKDQPAIGLYVFGSYDGRKWALVGYQEKRGKFSDIGCKVERVDCRYFRFCLAGQITNNTRFDYIEITADNSRLLSNKPR